MASDLSPARTPNEETLYIIDGHAQFFAYFAIRGGMNSPVTGEPTQAVFGMAGMLLKLFLQLQPHYVVMAVDGPGKTFRDDLYPDYKANRPPAPADLHSQEHRIFEMTRMFGVPVLQVPGAEADDIIATLVARVTNDPKYAGVNVRVVSKDKDLEQLLSDRVKMFDIHTDATMDVEGLKKEKGITPPQVVDMLAMAGDAVDNVPGVEGIGPKTAAMLVALYGSVEGILANLDKITGKRRENIEKARDLLKLSYALVKLKADLDFPFDFESARVGPLDAASLQRLFQEMGFRRHQAELDRLVKMRGGEVISKPVAKPKTSQADPMPFAGGLFDMAGTEPPEADSTEMAGSESGGGEATSASGGDIRTHPNRDYRAITTLDQLHELAATLAKQPLIALDTETIGLGHRAPVCGISLSWQAGAAVYIPICSPTPGDHLDLATVRKVLDPVFNSETPVKTGHNLKYDLLVLRNAGFAVRGVAFDSMIASHLLGGTAHGLDHLALALFKHRMIQLGDLLGTELSGGRYGKTMDKVPVAQITQYAADDAEISFRLHEPLSKQLKILGMEKLSTEVEMPLVELLAEMEFAGIRVNPNVLIEQKQVLAARIVELRDKVHELAGQPFNLDSPKQLAEILFTKLGLPVVKKTKSGASTDVEVLETLSDRDDLTPEQAGLLKAIIEYRQLSKLVGTYLEALRESIYKETGRVHASFHQTGAATGRLSSSDPNLQNIPIRTEVGRQIRLAFIAEPGQQLICADYSQIELRILAHLSGDPNLIAAFQRDEDIHSAVAAQVFNVPLENVTREQRDHAKTINFGIVYGVTPYGLARRIEGMTVESARKLISDYKTRFAGITTFLDRCVEQAKELGYVTTIMNRRRAILQIKAAGPQMRALGERLAINSVVQGSAADLIKLAMVNLYKRINREKLPLNMLLQIHDELVLEAPKEAANAMAEVVKHEMETAMTLNVPLKVSVGLGENWLQAK